VKPTFFATPEEMRAWLQANHATAPELWLGLYKKGSKKAGVSLSEAVDQALCFGWIDSLSRGIDDESYMLRFTRRRPRSSWAPSSMERVERLRAQGLMHQAGLKAFQHRRVNS
jgi:uncharacterized protein YdeI (YjbR/CyaY-like superfamily)